MVKKFLKSMVPARIERSINRELEKNRLLLGNQLSRTVRAATYASIQEAEFTVFSQFGEDGILQYLLGKVPVSTKKFIEFGVESYEESNTRFLLQKENWQGYLIDGGQAHLAFLEASGLLWRHDVKVLSRFLTRENINQCFRELEVQGKVGLLSVDIDGNDFWVLEAIDSVIPDILICEYNSLWGPTACVSVPYQADFYRTDAHYSNLYWGASLAAFELAADRKGLKLVGCNSAGNNAFFVREELLSGLHALSAQEAYVEARYRESRNRAGALTYLSSRAEKLAEVAALPLVDVKTGKTGRVSELVPASLPFSS